jgi:archaellin
MRKRIFLLIILCVTALLGWEGNMTKLTVVVKTAGGKPIDRAEVIIRWKASSKKARASYGRAVHTTFEVRSNQMGEATVPEIPKGNIQIQVNAHGYQTFGKVFDIQDDEKTVEVALNPPQQQYTSH